MQRLIRAIGLMVLGLLLSSHQPPPHALYLSLEEIRYEAPHLHVGFRIFTDDLEDALRHRNGNYIPIDGHWQDTRTKEAVLDYLQTTTHLSIDGAKQSLQLVNLVQQQDATWAACVIQVPPPPYRITIDNRLLLELFDTQKNLVRVYDNGEVSISQLDKTRTKVTVVMEK